jgi:undecaprenyl-diphosphatase
VAHDLGLLEAVGGGLLQGVAMVFPISGVGHAVLIGSVQNGAGADLAPDHALYLYACLRLAIGLALLGYFWRDWVGIGRGVLAGLTRRPDPSRRWSGLVLLAAIPGCVAVVVVDPYARHLLDRPRLAAALLAGNGLFMLLVWWWWRRSPRAGGMSGTHRARLTRGEDAEAFSHELATLPARRLLLLGLLPVASLVPGLSGVGLTLAVALVWGLRHEQAARVSLLLVTPTLIAWGLRDLADVHRSDFDGIGTAVLLGCLFAFAGAYFAAALLVRYFRSASLRPFGYYCLLAGGAALYSLMR